jgi:hypothetical protein
MGTTTNGISLADFSFIFFRKLLRMIIANLITGVWLLHPVLQQSCTYKL